VLVHCGWRPPIGAYEPRWFMRDYMNPADAVKALADCAEQALAHHHGTFQLTDEAIDAPVAALHAALEQERSRTSVLWRCSRARWWRFKFGRPGERRDP
jgi:L-ascorbate metabolism protein UlaG (beta-lactamase superfamily)